MPPSPVPSDPGPDEDLAWLDRDPMTAADREARLDRLCAQDDDPFDDPQEYWDPEASAPPPGEDELTGQELAGVRAASVVRLFAHSGLPTKRLYAVSVADVRPVASNATSEGRARNRRIEIRLRPVPVEE